MSASISHYTAPSAECNKCLKIPLKIWQTHKSKNLPKSSHEAVMRMIEVNPDCEHHFFDDGDVAAYMAEHFDDEVNRAFRRISPGAGKADIWRLAVILREGGIYVDADKTPSAHNIRFSRLLKEQDELVHGRNWHVWGYDAPHANSTITK